jgi:hypothetical protein
VEVKSPNNHKRPSSTGIKPKQEVYVLRDLKEYLGESLLIIFSVLLALFLTEYINNLHEKKSTREMLDNIKAELIRNKQKEQEQYSYQQNILKRIDSALRTPSFQQKILSDGDFHLNYIAPEGVVNRDLSTVAWDVAKSNNITTKAGFDLVSKLTDIYANQARIDKVEEKVADVLLSREARDPARIRETLILLRDNYKGWAFDRAQSLIKKYDAAIEAIDDAR